MHVSPFGGSSVNRRGPPSTTLLILHMMMGVMMHTIMATRTVPST